MAKKNLTQSVLTAAFAVAGLTLAGSDVQAMNLARPEMDLTKTSIMLSPRESQELNINSEVKFLGMNRFSAKSASRKGVLTGAAAPVTPSLTDLKLQSPEFLEGEHGSYTLTTDPTGKTHSIVIDGTIYYYTPAETTPEKNAILNYLAGSSVLAITTEGATEANSPFKIDNGDETFTYYTFVTDNLPASSFSYSAGTADDYNFKYNDGTTTTYHKIDLGTSKMTTSANIEWTKSNASGVSGYTWADPTTVPLASTPNYVEDGDGKLTSVDGAVRFNLPYNGSTQTQYYIYNWTNPNGTNPPQAAIDDLAGNISGEYFYGLPTSAVINNSDAGYDISADFIGNSAYKGAAVYNKSGIIGSITGDFIGNSADYDGAGIYNNEFGTTIGSITGDFIGNSAYDGAGILNYCTIGSIMGDFIGNSSSQYGAGVYNYGGSISSITGDFIGNSAEFGAGIYSDSSGYIGSITGDFIGNSSSQYGAGILNYCTIGSIMGDFIGNSSSQYGAGVYNNYGTIGSITGDFIGNSAITDGTNAAGAAIFNTGNASIKVLGDFIGNHSDTTSGYAYGGAIYNGNLGESPSYNEHSIITLQGNTFTGNYTKVGANETPNSIFNAGTINIANGATVTVNDGYRGLSTANLNVGTSTNSGSVFNLSVDNGIPQTDYLGNLTNNGTINWDLDVDIIGNNSDKISINSFYGTSKIYINAIKLLSDMAGSSAVQIATAYQTVYIPSSTLANRIYSPGEYTYTVEYDSLTGTLHFNGYRFEPGNATIDKIYVSSKEYLTLDKGEHNTYESLVTVKDDEHPDMVVINGTVYYFMANEGEGNDDQTLALRSLAMTGAGAIKQVGADDNWIFKADGKYYTYIAKDLPKSVWDRTDGTSSEYNYSVTDGTSTSYYNIDLRTKQMTTTDDTTWTKSNASGVSTYTWADSTTVPLASSIKPTVTDGKLESLSGAVRFNLPYKDNNTQTQYYIYNWTNPNGTKAPHAALDNLTGNFSGEYFYDLDTSAITNMSTNGYSVSADFIGNSSTGAGIYNTGTISSVTGNFISNNGSCGAGIYNAFADIGSIKGDFIANSVTNGQGAGIYNSGTINSITGNFIGNSVFDDGAEAPETLNGAGIYNSSADIGSISGDFIGNSAANSGAGIYNKSGNIGSITGDFIANKAIADSGAGIYNESGTIGSITGDFIGNIADGSGAGIYNNSGHIGSITGDFVGNEAQRYGSGIYNQSGTIGLIKGSFISNSVYYEEGILSNSGQIDSIEADFIGNSGGEFGGALSNFGFIGSIRGNFINNSAYGASHGYGGGIGNTGSIVSLTGDFIGNYGKDSDGGILNSGKIGLVADTRDIRFYNNTDSYVYSDIGQTGGTVYLNAADGHSITFNGQINGSYDSKIYINKDTATFGLNDYDRVTGGDYVFNNVIYGNDVYLYNGAKVTLGKATQADSTVTYGYFDGFVNFSNDANGGYINMQNNHIDVNTVDDMSLSSAISLAIDVDMLGTYTLDSNPGADLWDVTGDFDHGEFTPFIISSIRLLTDARHGASIDLNKGSVSIGSYALAPDYTIYSPGGYDYRVEYDANGHLNFFEAFVPHNGTIDEIYKTSMDYLGLVSSEHGQYDDDDLVLVKDADHPDVVVINGTVYYFKADEGEGNDDQTLALRSLAMTGASAIMPVDETENWIFNIGDNYYTYDPTKLPKSVWKAEDATADDYNYKTYVGTTPEYHYIMVRPPQMATSANVEWTKSDADGVSGYTWADPTTVPLASTPNYVEDGDGKLTSVDGAVRFNLPYNGSTQTQYYIYNWTNPNGTKAPHAAIAALDSNISGEYFYGLTTSAITDNDTENTYNISADFIGNSVVDGQGAGIYNNSGKIGTISGDFIGNSVSYLEAIAPTTINGGGISNVSGSIESIKGDFIGNSAYKNGAGVYNKGNIGLITGDFIGNTTTGASGSGAGIYNIGNIASISGDFIGNRAEGYGAGICNEQIIATVTGDFIGNHAEGDGAGIWNDQVIETVTGDFIGNHAEGDGAGIYNFAGIRHIAGDFIGNSATKGAGIYNYDGRIISIKGNFIENNATDIGGGIYVNGDEVTSITGDFIGNSAANGAGMYVCPDSVITSITGDFIGNRASAKGAGIYNNAGDIGLVAGSKDIIFYNNVDSTGYNDIYNYAQGGNTRLNLNAADGKSITFNGAVAGQVTGALHNDIYINYGSTNVGGDYVFNNKISGNNIYLYNNAKMTLGKAIQADETVTYGHFDNSESSVTITNDANHGIISTQNDHIDTTSSITTMTLASTIKLAIDADLLGTYTSDNNPGADIWSIGTLNNTGDLVTTDGSLIISSIRLLTDNYGETIITLPSALKTAYTVAAAADLIIDSPDGLVYTVGYNPETGELTFNGASGNSLAKQVHDDDPEHLVRSYEMTKIENVGENLGDLVGEGAKLSVDGGGYAIAGGEWEGINVAAGQTLEFENVSDVTGFEDDIAVTNAGTLNITDSKFTSDIINTNELNFNSTNTTTSINTFDGEIGNGTASTGTINIQSGKTVFNNTVTQADMTVTDGAQVEIGADDLLITNAVQNDGTVTLGSGTLTSSITNLTEQGTTGKTVIAGNVSVSSDATISQGIQVAAGTGNRLSANVASIHGAVENNQSLAIYSNADLTEDASHFTQAVTGSGTTYISGNVNVDSSIANDIELNAFEAANVVVSSTGSLGAEGKTITLQPLQRLTLATTSIAADSINSNGVITINDSVNGSIAKPIGPNGEGAGVLNISTTGDNAANVTISANAAITNQSISVNNGIFKLGAGGSLAGSSGVTVNDGAGFDSRDGVINSYMSSGKVVLADGSKVFVDISASGDPLVPVIDNFVSSADATVTLANINVLYATQISVGTVQLLSAGTVTGQSLFVQDDGNTIAVQGSGTNDGMITVGMTSLSDKLNGAVYVSGAVDAITYQLTADNEDVNPVGTYDALGTIKDSFVIKSSTPGTKKSLTAREGTFGLIVQAGKSLEVDDVVFKNFSTNDTYKGVITNYGTLTVKDSQFDMAEGNAKKVAIENYGNLESDPTLYHGAIVNHYDAYALIKGDTFDGSSRAGENGGAIYNEAAVGTDPAGVIEVSEDASHTPTTFINNVAASGGGIYNAGTATISNAVFGAVDLTDPTAPVYSDGNSAVTTSGGDGFGGAIYNSGSLSVTDTNFYANSAVKGGAIYSTANATINATSAAVEFADNTASTAGNDIYMEGTSGSPITLYLNSASDTNSITLNGGIDGSYYNVSVNNSTAGTVNIASLAHAATLALNGGTTNITSDTTVTTLSAADDTTLYASSASGLSTGTLTVDNSGTFTNSGKLTVTSTLTNGEAVDTKGTIVNNGVLTLTGTNMTNNGDITTTGTGNVTIGNGASAHLTNNGLITNTINVLANATLTTEGSDAAAAGDATKGVTGVISSAGTVELTGGTLISELGGYGTTPTYGTLNVTDNAAVSANVTVNELAVALNKTLTINNTSAVTVNSTLTQHVESTTDPVEYSTIANNGTLNLLGGDTTDLMSNVGIINGVGTLNIGSSTDSAVVSNTGSITGNDIVIAVGSKLTTSANNISDKNDSIVNDGTLELTSGTLSDAVVSGTGTTGHTDIKTGTVTFGAKVSQAINVLSGKLQTSADFIGGNVVNAGAGSVVLTGGTLGSSSIDERYTISSAGSPATAGTTDVTGNVAIYDENSAINEAINIYGTGAKLTANGASVGGSVAIGSGAELALNGGNLAQNITGYTTGTPATTSYGKLNVIADSTYSGTSATVSELAIGAGKVLTDSSAITVNDTLSMGSAASQITGAGNLNLYGSNMNNAGKINNTGTTTIGNGAGTIYTNPQKLTISATGELKGSDVVVAANGILQTNASNISDKDHSISNSGNIILTGGDLDDVISGGQVTINSTDTVTINAGGNDHAGLADGTTLNLTSGTLDLQYVTNDTTGDMDLSGIDIVTGDGLISVQDGNAGTITLGDIDTTAGDFNLKIDVDLGGNGNGPATADTLTLAVGSAIGDDNGITISNIHIIDPDHGYQTEDYIMLADDTIGDILDVTQTELTVDAGDVDAVKDLLINKVYEDGTGTRAQGTYLHTAHSDLDNAILSSIDDKMYFVGDNEIDNSAGALALGGNSLSITGNGATIVSSIDSSADPDLREDGIEIVDDDQVLTINNAQIGDDGVGFDTAIDNKIGGTVNLKDVTTAGNANDVINNGEIDVSDPANPVNHGVFLTGTNNIDRIVDEDADGDQGQTTVTSGTSTIGTLIQRNVNIAAAGTLNIDADQLVTTAGTANEGNLNLGGGDAAATRKSTQTEITGDGTTTVTGFVEVAQDIDQGTLNVGKVDTSGETPVETPADVVNSVDIDADDINITEHSTLTNSADATINSANGITNSGKLVNEAGDPEAIPATSDGEITANINNNADGASVDNNGIITGNITNEVGKDNITIDNDGTITGNIDNGNGAGNVLTNKANGTLTGGTVTNSGGTVENTAGGLIESAVNNVAGDVNTLASRVTGVITNDGTVNLSGDITDVVTTGNLATSIANGDNDTGTTNIVGTIATNGHDITQANVNVGTDDGAGTVVAGDLTNNDNVNADNIKVNSGSTFNNNSNVAAADGTSNSAIEVASNADLNLNAGSNTLGDVTLDAADSELTITDDGVLAGDVKSDNNGQINLIADTQDIVMSDAITGNLTSVDGTDVGAYIINATTADPTGTDTSVTIDKAIAGATTINVSADTNAIITNVATDSNSSALVFANSNSEITLRNDSTTDDMNVGMSVFDASADGYELNTENTSPDTTISLKGNIVGADDVNTNVTGGTTNIDGSVNAKNLNAKDGTTNINGSANVADVNTEVGATTNINKNSNVSAININTNGGTTNINETVNATNINANGGDTNLNANGDSKTSDKLASAKVNIQNGANVNVNTDSDSMTIDNKVKGSGSTSNLILNGKQGKAGSGSNAGTQFNLGTAVDNANVVVSNGQLNLPNESKLANGSIVDVGSGATLNTISGKASDYNTDITFEDASQVKTDINANTGKADRFVNVIQGENDGVVLTDAELQDLDKVLRHTTKIDLAKATNLHNLTIGEELLNKTFTEMTAIRKMSAKFSEDGMLTIMPSSGRNNYDDFNPAVVVGPIAAQLGGYLSQLNSYDEAFRNLDMKMLMTREERKALKMANSYASEVQPQVFSPTYLPEKDSAGWFRPYASFEKVNLKYGPNAENTMYGSYFGGDSSMKELRNGWDYQYSVYVGYNGSHQNYQGNSIYQNGGNLGATAIWYKDDFFTALTANVGASVADASTYYGSENFPMLMTGIASKTGYNWELAKGKFIIQPSYLMSYSFVHTFDYTNAAGVKISSNPLNAINIAPGLKFIGNLKHGWQPYAGVQMVWNIMDKADYKANDIPLPQMSVKPYFQYGVGVQKRWGERFTGFVQAMMRNGGRNGIALSGGLRWAIGKDYHSYPDYTPKSKAKTTIKTNNDAKVTTSTDVIKKSKQDVTSKNITKETTNKVTKPTKKSKLSQFFAFMNGEPTYVVTINK